MRSSSTTWGCLCGGGDYKRPPKREGPALHQQAYQLHSMADRGLITVRELGPYLLIYSFIHFLFFFTAVTKDAGGFVVIPFTVPGLIDRKAFKGGGRHF